ncbi:MAG: immunoglobulin domain-containing protein, partial [Planctomycetaceae bacterium]|nr:immunoglobulin domain-containing protein [Planctomycetaceae bacterium]
INAVAENVSGGDVELPAESDLVATGLPFGLATANPLVGAMFPTYNGSPAKTDVYIDDIYWDGDEGITLFTKKARNPIPENRSALVAIEQILSWEAPDDPNVIHVSGYDVYLDPNEVNVTNGLAEVRRSTNQPGTSFDPVLLNERQYFWRVDSHIELNDANHTQRVEPGKVWTFTTVPMTPVILTQPVNQVRGVKNGKPDAVFTVEAANAASYQWKKNGNPLIDGGNVSGALTATLTITNVTLADEGQYSCLISNGPANSVLSDTVWLEYARQTGQWAFEQDLTDSIGGNNGTFYDPNVSSGTFEAGKVGSYALALDGINDFAKIPVTALPKAGTEVTFAFWAYNNTPTVSSSALYACTLTSSNRLLNVHVPYSNGSVYFDVSNSDASGYDRISDASGVTVPEWVFWAFTKDVESGTMRVYKNGVLLDQEGSKPLRLYGVEQFFVGAQLGSDLATMSVFFNGLIDDLRIYNYSLDEIEAAYLYADSSGQPVCVYPNDAVLQTYDRNGDCRIGVEDMVDLAANWLYDQFIP